MPSPSADQFAQFNQAVERGRQDTDELLPLVYNELRAIARARLAELAAGQTLQATALVHEAYLRLAGKELSWDGPRHFIFAAARAMHDIIVERARHKARLKRGGGRRRLDLDSLVVAHESPPEEILALSEAMTGLERLHPRKHQIVLLRFFVGCSRDQAAAAMQLSPATVAREWRFARLWLHERVMAASDTSS
jgi:RNA polymerase sigma factor (TIGR02999 family)